MRRWIMFWALPLGGLLVSGCGSGSALVGGPEVASDAIALQAVSTRPAISVSRPTLSAKGLPSAGGLLVVGATVTLKNLMAAQISVNAMAVDSKKRVVGTQSMTVGEGGIWTTAGSGLPVPLNLTKKAVAYTIHVVATTIATPTLKKSLKAGSVTVAKSVVNPDQPPPPPPF